MPLRVAYGYDGQFFYRLAINPADFAHTAYDITVDQPYRVMRIGYPVITWLVSAGQRALVPGCWSRGSTSPAIGALAWLGGHLAGQGGRDGGCSARSLPGYFGLVTGVEPDTAELVAAAFMVAWIRSLLCVPAVPAWRWALLAFAVLTRETAMVAVAALTIVWYWLVRLAEQAGRD